MIKCLDTGEAVPLADAARWLPDCMDPLALQIVRRSGTFYRGDASDSEAEPKRQPSGKRRRLKNFLKAARKKTRAKIRDLKGARIPSMD